MTRYLRAGSAPATAPDPGSFLVLILVPVPVLVPVPIPVLVPVPIPVLVLIIMLIIILILIMVIIILTGADGYRRANFVSGGGDSCGEIFPLHPKFLQHPRTLCAGSSAVTLRGTCRRAYRLV